MAMTGTHAGDLDGQEAMPWRRTRASTFTLRDLLIAASFHIRIVLLAALIPLALGIAAAVTAKTEYTASSLLMVIVSREVQNTQNVTGNGPTVLSIEGLKQVETEVQILESADVIRSTIERIGIDRLFPQSLVSRARDYIDPGGSAMDKAVQRFRASLRANVLDGSNVIEVSFTHPDRELAVTATDTLVTVFMGRRRAIMENPTAQILRVEVERFKRDLTQVDAEIEALKTEVGIIDFNQDAVLAANQVDGVVQRRRQVAERKVAVAGQLAEAEKQLKALPETVFDFNQRSDALGNDDDNNALTRLLIERDRLSTQYAPNGSMMREINRKIETIRKQIATRNERVYQTDRDIRNPAIGYVSNMIISLRIEADALGQQDNELAQQQADAEKRLTTLRETETMLTELNRRRDTLSEGYREYLRRAVAASIEESAAEERESNVRLVQKANDSVTSRNMQLPFLGAGLIGAALFGVAAGAIASALRASFILPGEAERTLELPLLGALGKRSGTGDADSAANEVGWLAALLLDTQIDGRPLRTVQFIASRPDAESSRIARRVAEEMMTQRGLRTLFVDLAAGPAAGVDRAQARVRGGLDVAPSALPLLWTLADAEASPLLDVRLPSAEAHRMMEELKGEFEAVVFCAALQGSPLAASRVIHLVEGNVLVIRAEETRKAAALALRASVLENGGVPLGFVFLGRRYYLPEWIYRNI